MNIPDLSCYQWLSVMHDITGEILKIMEETGKTHLTEQLLEFLSLVFNGVVIKCVTMPPTF